ncbi:MAG TPA: hypothetical protein PK264_02840 [Hyphomicrobiaceae bacterium]|nr:hypothetical protein [Hyphomicrobiaceae bacterium]
MPPQDTARPGESIRLFLVSGRPDGLITAELINWTGHTLVGGIDDLAALVGRPEASRPGVYFLLGDDGDPTSPRLYIGESENVGVRLAQHERSDDKEFAECQSDWNFDPGPKCNLDPG